MVWTEDVSLTALEEDLLTLLTHKELYGLDIIKAMAEATDGKRRISFGSLYPMLHKLENRGFLQARWGDETPEERGGARRRYYRISAEGKRALTQAQSVRSKLEQWEPVLGV
jgi:PadR family transcriptional regulator, regulatory protein PadR